MDAWYEIGLLNDIPEDTLYPVSCAERPWILIRQGEDVRCFYDRCSHQDVRLSEFAQLDRGTILCFAHGARFCDSSGEALCFPGNVPLWKASVKVEQERVYLQLPCDLPD